MQLRCGSICFVIAQNCQQLHSYHEDEYKKAQLLLGKTRYSLYSSCCRTDLQSMIFIPHLKGRM